MASALPLEDNTSWRDWANHPEAVTAIWPRVLASGMPPASCLALLGTCQRTRNDVLLEAPRAKLTMQLGPEQPSEAPLLLLQQSGRSKPTTLSLLNSSTDQPAMAPAAQPPLTPQAASTYAQHILTHRAHLTCITRLDLQGIVVDPPLLKAMQGLPALTHLHLTNIHLSPWQARVATYKSDSLPQHLHTLQIELHPEEDVTGLRLGGLLTEFLLLDTITDLTILDIAAPRSVRFALEAVTTLGRQARALRKLCLPQSELRGLNFTLLQRSTPALEELQVFGLGTPAVIGHQDLGQEEVSWHTLQVHELELSLCRYLPLGGAQPLDIHVSGRLEPGHRVAELPAGIRHLTSQQTRPVRLVGSGRDGGAFSWTGNTQLVSGLSVLQLSKAPVRKLAVNVWRLNAEQLLQVLQPLPALTHLILTPGTWEADSSRHDQLLARLPLHVTHVRLDTRYDLGAHLKLFSRMAVAACTVAGRQASPLHLCVVGEGPGSEVWEAVEECRAWGDMGVVMEEAWD